MSLPVRGLFLAVAWLALEHVRPVTVELQGQRLHRNSVQSLTWARRVSTSWSDGNGSRHPDSVHFRVWAAACRAGTDVLTSDNTRRHDPEGLEHSGAS
jgi:hypothetical protein